MNHVYRSSANRKSKKSRVTVALHACSAGATVDVCGRCCVIEEFPLRSFKRFECNRDPKHSEVHSLDISIPHSAYFDLSHVLGVQQLN